MIGNEWCTSNKRVCTGFKTRFQEASWAAIQGFIWCYMLEFSKWHEIYHLERNLLSKIREIRWRSSCAPVLLVHKLCCTTDLSPTEEEEAIGPLVSRAQRYVYVYMYIYICIYVHISTYIHIYTYTHIYVYIYMHTHTHRHIHKYTLKHTHKGRLVHQPQILKEGASCICVYIFIYTSTYIYTYIHIYMYIYIYTHINIYI